MCSFNSFMFLFLFVLIARGQNLVKRSKFREAVEIPTKIRQSLVVMAPKICTCYLSWADNKSEASLLFKQPKVQCSFSLCPKFKIFPQIKNKIIHALNSLAIWYHKIYSFSLNGEILDFQHQKNKEHQRIFKDSRKFLLNNVAVEERQCKRCRIKFLRKILCTIFRKKTFL